jgi:hypothetical protein
LPASKSATPPVTTSCPCRVPIKITAEQGGQRVFQLAGHPTVDGYPHRLERLNRPAVDTPTQDRIDSHLSKPVNPLPRSPAGTGQPFPYGELALLDMHDLNGLRTVEPR